MPELSPFGSGHVFCFCNRAKNRVKCLLWDGSRLCAKRIERGTLAWPKHELAVAEMNGAQLQLLLEGFEVTSRRGWYRRGTNLKDSK